MFKEIKKYGIIYRILYIVPVVTVAELYLNTHIYGFFLPYISAAISSAVFVVMLNDPGLSKLKKRTWLSLLISLSIATLIQITALCILIDVGWIRDRQGTFLNFFAMQPWNLLVITPIGMSCMAILMNLWFSILLKKNAIGVWGGWLLSIYMSLSVPKILRNLNLMDPSAIFGIEDVIQTIFFIVIVTGLFASCLYKSRKECMRVCTV